MYDIHGEGRGRERGTSNCWPKLEKLKYTRYLSHIHAIAVLKLNESKRLNGTHNSMHRSHIPNTEGRRAIPKRGQAVSSHLCKIQK